MGDLQWGYTNLNGPLTWMTKFPNACGSRQSPIDIDTSKVRRGSAPPIQRRYSVDHPRSISNSGYSWRVEENGYDSELQGGPLGNDVYKLEQWHCHWGAVDDEGSEHTVDGRPFSGELHLVHWNSSKFNSYTEAAGKSNGLAVLAVLLTIGSKHEELDKIVKLLPLIQYKNDKVTVKDPLDPEKLVQSKVVYWTYSGSLTTPPCSESVVWIIFKEPIQVSAEQFVPMRTMKCNEALYGVEDVQILRNYRPTMPLGNRKLREIRYFCGNSCQRHTIRDTIQGPSSP